MNLKLGNLSLKIGDVLMKEEFKLISWKKFDFTDKILHAEDGEGPNSIDDYAAYASDNILGEGIFELLSNWDDIVAECPGAKEALGLSGFPYEAGFTLKIIVPYLISKGADGQRMKELAICHILPGTKEKLRLLNQWTSPVLITNSWEYYGRSVAEKAGFHSDNTFYIPFNIDEFHPTGKDREKALGQLGMIYEILKLPEVVKAKAETKSLLPMDDSYNELPQWEKDVARRIAGWIYGELYNSSFRPVFDKVNPLGGQGKADAANTVYEGANVKPNGILVVADSITDLKFYKWAREHGGVPISFNGNKYSDAEADIGLAIPNGDNRVVAAFSQIYDRKGRNAVYELAERFSMDELRRLAEQEYLSQEVLAACEAAYPSAESIRVANFLTTDWKDFNKRFSSVSRSSARQYATLG